MYTEYFAGMLRGTTISISLTHLRPVEPGHALADAAQTIYAADGDVLLTLHVVKLLRKEGDGWRLVDSRPYAFPPRLTTHHGIMAWALLARQRKRLTHRLDAAWHSPDAPRSRIGSSHAF